MSTEPTKQIDDGGPAFPRPESEGLDGWWHYAQSGMSLRDWLAGMALQGLLAGYTKPSDDPVAASCGIIRNQPQSMAELAALHADTLLAVLKGGAQ